MGRNMKAKQFAVQAQEVLPLFPLQYTGGHDPLPSAVANLQDFATTLPRLSFSFKPTPIPRFCAVR